MTTTAANEEGQHVGAVDQAGAAAYCGISLTTLKAVEKKNKGPRYFYLGRAKRYRLISLDAWMAALEDQTATEEAAAKEREKEATRNGLTVHDGGRS